LGLLYDVGEIIMKRHIVLEYRIRKLEKAILEDMDSDLDKMSDDILKRMPNDDLDAELDKKARDIVDKEPGYFYKNDPFGDHVKTYDTIEDWLDDKTIEIQLNPARPHKGDVVKDLNLAIKQLTHVVDGLNYVRRLKNYIKEISDMNVLKAQQKVVGALRKRIKEVEKSNGDNKKYEFDTINDWLDSIVFNLDLSNDNIIKVLNDKLKDVSLNFVGGPVWYTSINRLRKSIKEISDISLPVAQQKLVNALRKKIRDIKNRKQLESLTYEGKQDQEILNDFLGDDYYNKYQTIKNRISDPDYKDIYKLIKKDPNEVKDYIDNFKSNIDSIKAAKEGATKLYEDSDWVVYRITSYNAAKYYGKNTRWCISGNYPGHEGLGEKYFNNYIRDYDLDGGYYFYINKHNPNDKYCVLKKQSGNIGSIWDAKDTNIGDSLYWDDVDLPYVKEIGLNTAEQEDLLFAIKEGDLEMVKQCVNNNTINAVTPTGRTPLMIAAAKSGYTAIEIAAYLIDNGADVSYVSKDGKSALVIASESGRYEMVQFLVEYGHADVNNPMTEYGSAAYLGTDDEDIEEYLISKGAKVN
jgi:hypothetical protein